MLTSTVWWDSTNSTFHYFKQSLLYTFATDVSRDRRAVTFFTNFVYFVYKDYTSFAKVLVSFCRIIKFAHNIFYVVTNISRFGQGSGIRDGKWHIEIFCDSLCHESFS